MGWKHLFGPVPSRRLGLSMGVDVVPAKVCSLNCVYCQCGKTTDLTVSRREYVPYQSLAAELEEFFDDPPELDYVTFSGSGEPTLNSRIGDLISLLGSLTDDPVAVLTNGTLLQDRNVREDLMAADLVMPSLDAVLPDAFQRINRPHSSLEPEKVVNGLVDFRKDYPGEIWLEVFILPGYNDRREDLDSLRQSLERIAPNRIQLNTLDRPGAVRGLRAASEDQLQEIADHWALPGLEIISSPAKRRTGRGFRGSIEMAILSTLRRRPCTSADLQAGLSLHGNEVSKYLAVLLKDGLIESEELAQGIFYRTADQS